MNKVITINLGGVAYQLEDAGYDALRAYLDTAKARLQGNPDRDEILSDIERAIGEKFTAQLGPHKNVVLEKEVVAVLEQMGEIADEATSGASAGAGTSEGPTAGGQADAAGAATTGGAAAPRRLYRIQEGALIAGVCNGIGVYFNIDPVFVRLGFIVLTLFWGAGLLLYIAMAFLVPMAGSPEEKAAAYGVPATAQEFIRRAKRGYYDAMKSWPDRHARREWRRRFKQDMREWRASFHGDPGAGAGPCRPYWGPAAGPMHPGAALALPFFSLVHGIVLIFWLLTLISLLAHGTLLGVPLPAGLPVWAAVLLLLFVYGMVTWPLKAARRAYYYRGGGAGPAWALFGAIDAVIWIAVVLVLLNLAYRHLPEAREAIQNLPAVAHDAADSFRDWWHGKG